MKRWLWWMLGSNVIVKPLDAPNFSKIAKLLADKSRVCRFFVLGKVFES